MSDDPKKRLVAQALDEDALKRRRLILWAVAVGVSLLLLLAGILVSAPPPPAKVALATGVPTGAYARHGTRYAEALGKNGLTVTLRNTEGSVENIRLLLKGEADVAFVQGGVSLSPGLALGDALEGRKIDEALRSMAAVYFEPLWVFTRGDGPPELLTELRGKRIAVGARGSGTLALATDLLRRNEVTDQNATFVRLNAAAAAAALLAGEADVAMMVTSHESEDVLTLLRSPGVHLMSFRRYVAYVRTIPYLGKVDLTQGMLDLGKNAPRRDVVLLAPAATLVCRRDLHPAIVYQFLRQAKAFHGKAELMVPADTFPNAKLVDLPLHEAAEEYFQSGMPTIVRLLPFWLVRLASKFKILLLPLVTLLLPLFRSAGGLYSYRFTSVIRKCYTALRDVEREYHDARSPAQLAEALLKLRELKQDMADLAQKAPGSYQMRIFRWREHCAIVRADIVERLDDLRGRPRPAPAEAAQPQPRDAKPKAAGSQESRSPRRDHRRRKRRKK